MLKYILPERATEYALKRARCSSLATRLQTPCKAILTPLQTAEDLRRPHELD